MGAFFGDGGRADARVSWRRRGVFLATPLLAVMLAACQANPGDAPTVEQVDSTAESAPPTAPPDKDDLQLHVGIGSFTGNLNPHLTGNVSATVMGIADLTLPSTHNLRDGAWEMNSDLLLSVTPNDPQTPIKVTYQLNTSAQWSDGTPVNVSDFRYLRQQIVQNPSTAEAASYELIKSIEPVSGGKIEVTFSQPFAGWQSLFRHLLPSHIYGAENQPFATMMDGNLAASAGAYAVTSIDEGRGRIELRRNDRFWGDTPAATDRLIFDRIPDLPTGMQMLRTGQIEMMVSEPSDISTIALESIPGVQYRAIERHVDLSFLLNTHSSTMAVADYRARIMQALNPDRIAQIATESTHTVRPANPPIEAAAVRGAATESTNEQTNDPARALGSLSGDGAVVIGAPSDDDRAVAAARVAADQLNSAGITTRVVTKDEAELFAKDIPEGTVDAVVSWQKTPESSTDYFNQFYCSPKQGGTSTEGADAERNSLIPLSGNITGYCSEELNLGLLDTIEGKTAFAAQQDKLNERIAQANVVVPLVRDTQVVATGPAIEGAAPALEQWAADPLSGVMVSAPDWKKLNLDESSESLEGEQ